ncbi:hypothetical protein ACJX0J_041071, partial [Zea mays]
HATDIDVNVMFIFDVNINENETQTLTGNGDSCQLFYRLSKISDFIEAFRLEIT